MFNKFPQNTGCWQIAIYYDFLIKKIFQWYRLINFIRLPVNVFFVIFYKVLLLF